MPSRFNGTLLRILATSAAFALGLWGFSVAYAPLGGGGGILAWAFDTLQLVVGRFPENLQGRPSPIALRIARTALPLMTFWTSATLAWVRIRNPVRAWLIRRGGDHFVIAGDEGLAAMVARGERRAKRRVMVWAQDPSKPWVRDLADLGIPSVAATGLGQHADRLGLDRARGVLLAGPDDAANVALAAAAMEQTLKRRPAGDPLQLIARVDDPDLRAPLEQRFDWTGDRSLARLRFASLPAITARRLFLREPIDAFLQGEETARRLFLLGFSPTSEAYAVRLLAGGHFRDGGKPEVVVLDQDADRKRRVFEARRPGVTSLAPVTFEAVTVDEPALVVEALERAIGAWGLPNAVVIDPPVASRALPLALAVDAYFRKRGGITPPIHARMNDDVASELGCSISPFGGLQAFADTDLLLQEKIDSLARAIHEFYLEGRLALGDRMDSRLSMHEWDLLPEEVRDDNRLVADCYELKLRDIGARFADGAGDGLAFEKDELEELARAEHDRWMAAKLLDGWRWGAVRDDGVKLHPNIVGYDELDEPTKEIDREQIRIIARLAGQIGRRAVRDLVVWLKPGAAPPSALAAGMPALLGALAAQYPDRAVVLLGSFEDPAARAALQTASAVGAIVRLDLAVNAEATLTGLERGERVAARKLFRAADQIYALPAKAWPEERRTKFLAQRVHARVVFGSPAEAIDDLATVVLDSSGRIARAPWVR